MILSREAIKSEIEAGRIRIEPFREDLIGSASLDLTVSRFFRRLSRHGGAIDVKPDADYRNFTNLVEIPLDGFIEVTPGETILGITHERIALPDDLCGWFEGRSRFARLGLLVHISAGFMQPGTDNNQVLEISNMAARSLRLYPGTPLCQFIFQRMQGKALHQGRYTKQSIDDFCANPPVKE